MSHAFPTPLLVLLGLFSVFSTWNLTRKVQIRYRNFQEDMFRANRIEIRARIVMVRAKQGRRCGMRDSSLLWRKPVLEQGEPRYVIKAKWFSFDFYKTYSYTLHLGKEECRDEPEVGGFVAIAIDKSNPYIYQYDGCTKNIQEE